LPQWNCSCWNCRDARLGHIPTLTQSSVALSDDAGSCFLINASPDLPVQIEAWRNLQPNSGTVRNNPVSRVLLTNADLDHVLGIFSLREGERLHIHATAAIRKSLDAGLHLTPVMNSFCGIDWCEPPETDFAPLVQQEGKPTALVYRAIRLPGNPPLFDPLPRVDGVHSVAYHFMDRNTGGRLLLAPDVAGCTEALVHAMRESDAVILDGTFWSEDELMRLKPGSRTSSEMGHITIKDTSLPLLKSLGARHKIYIHVNNTNPVLSPNSPERALVEAAGVQVGQDGLEFAI
jgi:pyrroloquinoline quinone biosynthesis protein B